MRIFGAEVCDLLAIYFVRFDFADKADIKAGERIAVVYVIGLVVLQSFSCRILSDLYSLFRSHFQQIDHVGIHGFNHICHPLDMCIAGNLPTISFEPRFNIRARQGPRKLNVMIRNGCSAAETLPLKSNAQHSVRNNVVMQRWVRIIYRSQKKCD